MRDLNPKEILLVSGGRQVEGAYSSNGPDRTSGQSMRENNPGRDWTSADLRNAGLALGVIGSVVPGAPGRVITAIGAGSAALGGWEDTGSRSWEPGSKH